MTRLQMLLSSLTLCAGLLAAPAARANVACITNADTGSCDCRASADLCNCQGCTVSTDPGPMKACCKATMVPPNGDDLISIDDGAAHPADPSTTADVTAPALSDPTPVDPTPTEGETVSQKASALTSEGASGGCSAGGGRAGQAGQAMGLGLLGVLLLRRRRAAARG